MTAHTQNANNPLVNNLLEIRRITGLLYNEVMEFARVLHEAKLLDKSEI